VLMDTIGQRPKEDEMLLDIFGRLVRHKPFPHDDRYSVDGRGWLKTYGRLYVPILEDILEEVLLESHCSRMTIHPRGDKMYRNMKRVFYWSGMKRKVTEYVSKCLPCQRVKAEQEKPGGLLLR